MYAERGVCRFTASARSFLQVRRQADEAEWRGGGGEEWRRGE